MHDAHVYYACNVVIVSELITSNTNATLSAPYCTHMYQLNKKSVFASSHIMNVFQKKKKIIAAFFFIYFYAQSLRKRNIEVKMHIFIRMLNYIKKNNL